MNESETRAEHIDPALARAGWGVVEGSRIRREYEISPGRIEGAGRRGKRVKADYILEYRNTKLAVVEAKAWDLPLTEGVAQAKDYAGKLAIRFTYSANGQGVYGIDMEAGTEGELPQFPTPEELWERTFAMANAWRDRFAAVPFPDKSGHWTIRFYQELAVNRALAAISAGRDRVLLTLATGTGKTSIAFQIAWKLFQARWNLSDWREGNAPSHRPKILFLADRNNLATQAYNDFTSFAAFAEDALVRIKPDEIRQRNRVPTNGSIFFTIFQTFMSGPPREGAPSPYFGDYPPDFFDFIIVDECHRGGANDESSWRDILNYFSPAVQLGLTATPKRNDNVDTYAYFGEPVFTYSLKDGINDGFLTPFRVRQIATTLDDYVYTPDDTLIEGEIEAGRRYGEADFNRIIEIREREKKRVEIFMGEIDQREKTIVFCATQAHALVARDLISQMKSSKDPGYCERVTANDGALGDEHLRSFQDNEKTIPTILTTSQKLSTGVDARNVRNIVLMRPVNSMIEFKQIIGRGTRLYDGKDYFTIYDFVRAHHHFSDPEWDGEPIAPESNVARNPEVPATIAPGTAVPEPSDPYRARTSAKVKLSDGKARTIQHMMCTSFWHPDGTPMSAQQFMELLFGKLPEFFRDEDELRSIWSDPDTRRKLLEGLSERGFGRDQLLEMQKIIHAEKSDLFDVLSHVSFASNPKSRIERASAARKSVAKDFTERQQAFVNFVLDQYESQGVDELDIAKLPPLLRLRYGDAISDAIEELGDTASVRRVFVAFQPALYAANL
jgi:type I restriction enzyme, R subunit